MVQFFRIFVLALSLAAMSIMGADAAEKSGRTPLPPVVKAFKGQQCIEPVGVMRRLHGEYLYHQRDETLRQGIRGKKYSLLGCIECHAVPDPKSKDKETRSVEPFCASCHKYTATTIDCFTCHSPFAEKKPLKTGWVPFSHPGEPGAGKAIVDQVLKYLTLSQAGQ